MLRILLVDDEKWILEGLKRIIQWEEFGFKITDAVQDGQEAISIALDKHPDVIITDIRMPSINGLELIKQLKGKLEFTRFIILSGYDDFKYAQQAIEYGAYSYILKPVDEDKLIPLIKRVKTDIYREKQRVQEEKLLYEKYKDSLDDVKKNVLNKLLFSTYEDLSSTEKDIFNEIDNRKVCYQIAVMKVDKYLNNHMAFDYKDSNRRKLIEKIISDALHTQYIYEHREFTAYVLMAEQECERAFFENICLKVSVETGNTVSICLSKQEKHLNRIKNVFDLSLNALTNKRFFHGRNKVYEPLEMIGSQMECKDIFNVSSIRNTLRKAIAALDSDCLGNCLSYIKEEILKRELVCSIRSVKNFFILLMEHVADIIVEEFDADGDFLKDMAAIKLIDDIDVFEDIIQLFESTLVKIIKKLIESHGNSVKVINAIKLYVKDNFFNSDITLEGISRMYHLNMSYLSSLFKKESGLNFTEYLTKVRIDEAKNLLEYSDIKIDDLAYRIGYKNNKYFNYVFKKECGMSPAKYRKMHKV